MHSEIRRFCQNKGFPAAKGFTMVELVYISHQKDLKMCSNIVHYRNVADPGSNQVFTE